MTAKAIDRYLRCVRNQKQEEKGGCGIMDAKTGIAIGLVVFILAALVFLKIRAKKK